MSENAEGRQAVAEPVHKVCRDSDYPSATQDGCIQRRIAARLANEVQDPISRRRINLLRKQIQSGAYQVNATAIASRMLLEDVLI